MNNNKSQLIKGIIFQSEDNIPSSSFSDLNGDGYIKLGNKTYMYIWHDGSHSHYEMQLKISEKYDIINDRCFAISESNGELDVNDINRVFSGEYGAYKPTIIAKSKKYFRDSINKEIKMDIKQFNKIKDKAKRTNKSFVASMKDSSIETKIKINGRESRSLAQQICKKYNCQLVVYNYDENKSILNTLVEGNRDNILKTLKELKSNNLLSESPSKWETSLDSKMKDKFERYIAKEVNGKGYILDKNWERGFKMNLPIAVEKDFATAQRQCERFNRMEEEELKYLKPEEANKIRAKFSKKDSKVNDVAFASVKTLKPGQKFIAEYTNNFGNKLDKAVRGVIISNEPGKNDWVRKITYKTDNGQTVTEMWGVDYIVELKDSIKDRKTTTVYQFRNSDLDEEGSWLGTTEWGTPKGSLYVYKKDGKIVVEAKGVAYGDPKGIFKFNTLQELNRWLLHDSIKDVELNKDESKEEFIARFMNETKSEYPDEKQRYAVANSYWKKAKDSVKDEDLKKISKDEWLYKGVTIEYNSYGKPPYYFVSSPDKFSWMYSAVGLKDLMKAIDRELVNPTKDSVKDSTYTFPLLTPQDIKVGSSKYGLKFFRNLIKQETYATGTYSQIKKFAKEYLDYEINPDYMEDSIKDEDITELSQEEMRAIEDYKKAISNTKDIKLLNLYSHILKEEIEHLEELNNAKSEVKDSDYDYNTIKEQIKNPNFSTKLLLQKAYNGLTRGEISKDEYKSLVEEIKSR